MSAQDIASILVGAGTIFVGGGTLIMNRRKTQAEAEQAVALSQEVISRAAEKVVQLQGGAMDRLKLDNDAIHARLDTLTVEHAKCQREVRDLRRRLGES